MSGGTLKEQYVGMKLQIANKWNPLTQPTHGAETIVAMKLTENTKGSIESQCLRQGLGNFHIDSPQGLRLGFLSVLGNCRNIRFNMVDLVYTGSLCI